MKKRDFLWNLYAPLCFMALFIRMLCTHGFVFRLVVYHIPTLVSLLLSRLWDLDVKKFLDFESQHLIPILVVLFVCEHAYSSWRDELRLSHITDLA